MSILVNKYEYIKRKLKKMKEIEMQDKIEISNEEAKDLKFTNYFLGATTKDSFETSDLNEYVDEKPNSITVPATFNEEYTVWIYPESWGRPTSAISSLSNMEEIQTFTYDELNLPLGYIGMWLKSTSVCTYTLTW